MILRVFCLLIVCAFGLSTEAITGSAWGLQTNAAAPSSQQQVDSKPEPDSVHLNRHADKIEVMVGDKLFTTFDFKTYKKPILYPIYGPGQVRMTRDWPMEPNSQGESHDHPHHKSMWFSSEINGINFWTEKEGRVAVKTVETSFTGGPTNVIQATADWISNRDDKVVLTDETTYWFGGDSTSRWINCLFELQASHGGIKFEDSKEGLFAIRTHPDLRLKAWPTKGVKQVFGNAINSEGDTANDVWGKRAKWVLYYGPVDGKPVSILMCDHPTNLRHPTTWHARDYGLVAANPFGLHEFLGKKKGQGEYKVAAGDVLQLRYRVEFFAGIITAETAEEKYQAFSKQPLKTLKTVKSEW